MNSTKTEIAKINLEREVLDLQPIYTVGREIDTHDQRISFQNLEKLDIDDDKKQKLTRVVKNLLSMVKGSHVPFHPSFIELSLFDPEDRKGDRYFSILIASHDRIIGCYKKEMEKNLQNKNAKEGENRGPIIPNKKLHKSAYYSTFFDTESEKTSKFNEIVIENAVIEVGKFETTGHGLNFTKEKEKLVNQIRNFLNSVGKNCMSGLNNNDGKYVFNSALLIPLFRPAAIFKGEDEYIFNGGGVFLFGNIEKPNNETEFILELQSNLAKAIFKASFSQIVYDQNVSFQVSFIHSLMHKLKDELTNKISRRLSYMINYYPVADEDFEKLLHLTKTSSEKIVKQFNDYLQGIGFLRTEEEENVQRTNFHLFLEISRKICDEYKLKSEYKNSGNISKVSVKIHPKILELILNELVLNAVNYYNKFQKDPLDRKIIFRWILDDKTRLSFYTISNQTFFEKVDEIGNYGRTPMINTGSSSGLGGYFINELLKQVGAMRFPDGRYFHPENTIEGFSIKIEFNTNSKIK